jgi:Fe-S cluster biogenesis protein NfuA
MSPSSHSGSATLHERVAKVIDAIRPTVQADGGDVEFVGVGTSGIVQVRLHGACVGCPSSTMTLKLGIERNLRTHVPEVKGIETVP